MNPNEQNDELQIVELCCGEAHIKLKYMLSIFQLHITKSYIPIIYRRFIYRSISLHVHETNAGVGDELKIKDSGRSAARIIINEYYPK